MKTITTIAASMMLMATTASATLNPTTTVGTGSALWIGTEDNIVLPDMCEFTQNTPGVMKLDTDKQTWKTDAIGGSAAVLKISFRGVSRIKVEADDTTSIVGQVQVPQPSPTGNGVIYETPAVDFKTGAFDADVTYKGSKISIIPDGTNSGIYSPVPRDDETFQWRSWDTITSGTPDITAGVATVTIAGKAKPTGTAIYDADAEYRVPHKVTCLH